MQNNHSNSFEQARYRLVHGVIFVVAMLSLSLQSLNAIAADLVPDEYRTGKVVAKFDDAWQSAAVFKLRPPRRLRAKYLKLAVGAISTPTEVAPYVSLGP